MTNEKMMAGYAALPDAEYLQAGKITDPIGSGALYSARTVVSLLAKERERCARICESLGAPSCAEAIRGVNGGDE